MTAYFQNVPASPCTTNTASLNFPASPVIPSWMLGNPIKIDDKIPKRLGGKDYSMKDINKLRYPRSK